MKLRRLLLLIALALLVMISLLPHLRKRMPQRGLSMSTTWTAQVPALVRALRPAYPFSIIPGGVYSKAELANHITQDSLVRRHYADFRMESARLAVLQEDQIAYVSYRKNNSIFWTRRQIRIPKGELVLTDGTHIARARCGNRLSEIPMQPTAPQNDPAADLALGPLTPALLRDPRIGFAPRPESAAVPVPAPPNAFLTPAEITARPSPIPSTTGLIASTELPAAVALPASFPLPGGSGSVYGIAPVLSPTRTPAPSIPVVSNVPEPAGLLVSGLALITGAYSLKRWRMRKP
jgi:hypothetical protein